MRVLVVEDHRQVREGMTRLVEAAGDITVVGAAETAEEALRLTRSLEPDVVLMDVSIPGSSGVALTETITQQHPSIMVIGVSRHDEPAVISSMYCAGARGYVLKQNMTSQLIPAIRAIVQGREHVDESLRRRHTPPDVDSQGQHDTSGSQVVAEEQEVLRLVAAAQSNRQIAECLGIAVEDAVRLKGSAMRKAGLSSRAQVIAFVRRQGWLDPRD